MNQIIEASPVDIEKAIDNKESFIVDFWAPWCGPCKMLVPVLDKLCQENSDVKVYKINIDDPQNSAFASAFKVRGIPTLLHFKEGQHKGSRVGFASKEALKEWLSS